MGNLNLLLFISIIIPLAAMLFVFKAEARTPLVFLMVGMGVCLFSGEVNAVLMSASKDVSLRYYVVNISPLLEELFKAVPVFLYAFILRPKAQVVLECSVACGVGFAILENAGSFVSLAGSYDFMLAVVRGLGAGMMHVICTLTIGVGILFIYRSKKLFYTGSVALLAVASIFHSIYNALIDSRYEIAGLLLPVAVFIPLIIFGVNSKRNQVKESEKYIN